MREHACSITVQGKAPHEHRATQGLSALPRPAPLPRSQPPAHAACTANLALQPASSLPALGGRLVYHSYMEYGDGSSNLYLHDFKSKSTRQLNQPGWNIEDPMNAHFSPDGRYLTFMGRQNGAWHVFAWAIGGTQAPSNLTAAIGGRNEDPKFSFDGRQVVLKHEGDIRLATLVFNGDGSVGVSAWKAVTSDGWSTEESMPFLTPSGKYVVYATGAGDSLRVVRRNLENGQVSPLATPAAGAATITRWYATTPPTSSRVPSRPATTSWPWSYPTARPAPRRSCRSTTARATIPMPRR